MRAIEDSSSLIESLQDSLIEEMAGFRAALLQQRRMQASLPGLLL
jgi:hypothetical protein